MSWPSGGSVGAGAFGLFHPDIRIEQPASLPHGGRHQGHEGVTAMGAAFGRVWSRSISGTRILGCGESVVQVTTAPGSSAATVSDSASATRR